MLGRLATWCFKNPWKATGVWIFTAVAIGVVGGIVGVQYEGGMTIPASESKDGFDAIETYFGKAEAGRPGSIVVKAETSIDDPAVKASLTKLFEQVEAMKDITLSSPYEGIGALSQVSEDRKIAFASINSTSDSNTATAKTGAEILTLAADIDGVQIELGGSSFAAFEPPQSELIGVAFAIVILILAFGSVLAMGLPIGVALAGVGTGLSLVGILSNVMSMPEFGSTIGAMIGLGVGIDYALFIVTRYREELHQGAAPADAVRIANNTEGKAVLFAGLTVVVSLLGMLLIGLPFISGLGVGSAVTVVVTMIASLTLLPALLGFAGDRVERTRWRGLIAAGCVAVALLGLGLGVKLLIVFLPVALLVLVAGFFVPKLKALVPQRKRVEPKDTVSYKWSRSVQRHPWLSVAAGVGVLGLLALPVFGLRLGFSDEGNFPEESTTRKAYDLLAEGFGPGFNGPLLVPVVADIESEAAAIGELKAKMEADPGVQTVLGPIPAADDGAGKAALFRVIPKTAPQDLATEQLVQRLRSDVLDPIRASDKLDAFVTGFVPIGLDFSSYLGERTLLFFGVVLALSFVLLMMVFRSILVPLKAVVMNMLSIGAAYGVVVAIFQWGWLGSITGVEAAPIEPFIPMMMFAILFGLSMDYEVFLLSRVREEFMQTGDPVGSVADGLASTARVISAAAAIMVVVFGAFILEDNRIPNLFGLGLAVAVFLDATLVRMLLVPATMELLGARNWWIPSWLDKVLPKISIE